MSDALALLDRVLETLDGAQRRTSQRDMVHAVEAAWRDGRHLAVQGPTGVGKSLAYLAPAVTSAAHGHRTVVVTSSKALQDQLASVDIPLLGRATGERIDAVVLKGRSNYLCAAALADVVDATAGGPSRPQLDLEGIEGDLPPTGLDLDDADQRAQVERLLVWAQSTESGDVAELDRAPDPKVWAAVSVGPGECVGAASCSFASECWSEAARARADEADIVVVNAHLYGAHVRSGRTLLPEHDQLVIDEAHEFEDSIVGSLSIELTAGRLSNLANVHDRNVADGDVVTTSLRSAATMLDATFEGVLGDDSSHRLRDGPTPEVAAALARALSASDRALNSLRRAARAGSDTSARHRLERAVRVADSLVADLQSALGELGPGSVCWVEANGPRRRALRVTRIDVAETLAREAWSVEGLTVVCCSATLDPGTAGRLGLEADYVEIDSPFDFATNAVLWVPKVHVPSHPRWSQDVTDVLVHLIARLDGRTLALFTSTRVMREVADAVRSELDEHVILVQGEAPHPAVRQQFLSDEHASLFATASFWTGMSSPGPTCSAVVIDKLPFPVPTDPVVEARCELVGPRRAFMEVSVPAAALQLAQGVGRLIRTTEDRGVVAVCDPRLAESRYRDAILDRLPPMRRMRNQDAVDRFIATLELECRGGTPPGGDGVSGADT